MPRTNYDEVYQNGQLVSRTVREVSDAEIELQQDQANLRALVTLAQKPEREWTQADVVAVVRLLLRDRLRRELREAISSRS